MYFPWQSLPYRLFFLNNFFHFIFFAGIFIVLQPYSNLSFFFQSFSGRRLAVVQFPRRLSVGSRSLSLSTDAERERGRALARSLTRARTQTHTHMLYTHLQTAVREHTFPGLLSFFSPLFVFNLQSLFLSFSYQSDAIHVWCKMLLSCDFLVFFIIISEKRMENQ